MSQTRRVALSAVLLVSAVGASAISSVTLGDAHAVAASWSLVEANWCEGICDQECETCETATPVGCNCYWLCADGGTGSELCPAPSE